MEDVLDKITNGYVRSIQSALLAAELDDRLYCAFFPFFAWTAPADELPSQGLCLDLLHESKRQEIIEKHHDLGKASYYSYSWAEFYGPNHRTIQIDDKELESHLLNWYRYQQSDEFGLYEKKILNQIGKSCTDACQQLNQFDWPDDRFTDDFIVFTSCAADDPNDFGMKQCLTESWISKKTRDGWFTSYFPLS